VDIVAEHRPQENYSSCYQLKQNKLFLGMFLPVKFTRYTQVKAVFW